jgi:anti-anti-sigma factor
LPDAIAAVFLRRDLVIVDLVGASYMDGAGIRVLTDAAQRGGAHLAVAGTADRLRRIFDIVHLADVLPLVASVEAGQERLRHQQSSRADPR